MGFMAALPWIIKGGSALAGMIASKKAQSSAMKRGPEEQVGLTGEQQAAGQLRQQGGELVGEGRATLEQPTNYWSRLLGGNRAQMAQATAAPRGAITDIYRGAERGLERSGVRGAQRDVASAELNRQQAGQIAGLTTGVQPAAAGALTDIGAGQISQGAPMIGQAGGLYANLLGQGAQNRRYGREEGEKTGSAIGSMLFDVLSGKIGEKVAGGKGVLPSKPILGGRQPMFGAPNLGG